MRFDVVTLFPEMFGSYVNESILRRAQDFGRISLHLHNLRNYGIGKHRITDEPPFGGGGGMILKPEPLFAAVNAAKAEFSPHIAPPVILMTPQGRPFTQTIAQELSQHEQLVLICGRYEGVDERVRQQLVTDEISIGDYVLTGGELAAMVIIDAVTRLLPDVLGDEHAASHDSHATGLLEGPHYTKPVVFEGSEVPKLLRSGDTKAIERWRKEESLRRTWQRRPEMLFSAELTPADKHFLATLAREETGLL